MDLIIKPRQLTITWGDDDRYWEWIDGETPRLLSVYWFKIRGRFAMSHLTHGAKYQLMFEVELESWAKGWESPVTLKMLFPDGRSTTRVETLDHHPREQLLMLCVGEFEASGNGEIEFEMAETNDQKEKKGLVIRRVVIQPSSTTTPQERSALPRNPAPQSNPSASSQDLIIKLRQLTITWGDDGRYWEWIDGETPRLLSVYWFKIRGRFAMSRLTHGAKYQLTFEVELESWAKGWESPVTLKMVFPDGRSTTRVETLDHHPREQLLMLCVGEFEASGNGEIKFKMAETNDQKEKKGLVIRRVVIQPSSTTTPQERSALPRNPAPQSYPSASSQDLNMEQRQLSTTGRGYLIIEPRQLSITGADDERRWHWIDGMTPRLLGALGVEIRGRFDMSRLTHGATYQLAFGVELESSAKGWESPVTLKLDLPDGLSKTRIVSLNDQPRDQLLFLQVGDFVAGGHGEIKFSMVEAEEHSWKEGLVVKRVVIKSSLLFKAKRCRYGSRDVGGGGRRFCYDCGETGHTSDECPMKG